MGQEDVLTKGGEMTEVLTAAFTMAFAGKTCLQQSQAPEIHGKVWSKEDLPLVEEDQIMEHFYAGHTQVRGTWWDTLTSAE